MDVAAAPEIHAPPPPRSPASFIPAIGALLNRADQRLYKLFGLGLGDDPEREQARKASFRLIRASAQLEASLKLHACPLSIRRGTQIVKQPAAIRDAYFAPPLSAGNLSPPRQVYLMVGRGDDP